jgi:hypothetical protein
MSITARHAQRRATNTLEVVEQIADTIADTITAIRTAIDDERAGKPKAEDVGIRGIGWIGRPTEDAAIANLDHGATSYAMRQMDAIAADLDDLVKAATRLAGHCQRWTYSGRPEDLAPDPRCSGGKGHGVADWVRPDCDNPAARIPGTTRLRGDGLCDACRVRKSRYDRRVEEVA